MNLIKPLKILLDIVLPQYCLNCKEKGAFVCQNCLKKAQLSEIQEENPHITSVFNYHDPIIKKSLWQLKYKNKKVIAEILSQLVSDYLKEEIYEIKAFSPGKPIILIPVPLSKKRQKERGFNQSELIAKNIIKNYPENIFELQNNLILKIKETPPQAKILNKRKRIQNIKDAFILNEKENFQNLRGRTFIIIDDISTTGGTINEIRKLFKKLGAKKILGLTIAH